MRKFYSFVLMAAALLIGTNTWAGTYNAGTTEEFETAWAKSATEDVVINLTSAGVNLSKTMWLGTVAIDGTPHSVEINLNGFPLTSSAKNAFVLTHGTLKFSGNGQVSSTGAGEMIYITGSTNKDVDPSKSVAENNNKPYFSHLIIGEGVTFATEKYYAIISIDGVRKSSSNIAYAANANYIPAKSTLSYITNVYASAADKSAKSAAHGVRVDIYGNVNGTKYGIKANGDLGNPNYYFNSTYKKDDNTVAFTSDLLPEGYVIAATDVNYAPYIYIAPSARITANATKGTAEKSPVALYASGFARWQVEGFVSGSVGALVKSGDVNFENATVEGTGEKYAASTPTTSGTTACGSAIAMESNSAYTGDINVTIGGDSKVSATNGYAIDEAVVTANNQTKVDAITINGGVFQGGKVAVDPTDPSAGTMDAVMKVSEITAEANLNPNEETTITIIGATTNSNESGAVTIGTQSLAEFLSDQTTETHITQVEVEPGKTIWVISEGGEPDKVADGVEFWNNGDAINWKNTGEDDTPMEDEVAADLKLAELQMIQSYSQQLTVKEGVTFEVGNIIMGANAKIIVEAGGTFIVSGNQGITAPSVNNIVLQHNSAAIGGGKYATFVFDPNVTSNRHPNATVEFTTKSWREGSDKKQWEWFGVPTYNAVKSIAASCPAYVAVYENGDWQDIGLVADISASEALRAKLNKPFAAYDLLANRARTVAAPTITITGELVGNVNATLNAYQKWNPFANSYTAEVDAEAFVNGLSGNIADAIYLAKQNNNGTITWNLFSDDMLEGLKLQPMQAFLLLNNGATEEATINYESMVYDPATPNNAPSRFAAEENTTKVTINVANENGTWDDVDLRENGKVKSLEKYLNDDVNIYVVDGEKNDYVAAEDLENTYVGFSTVNGGNFTISFAKAEGREFDLIDLETGARVAVSEGETYSFSAAANTTNDYRFKLVAPAKMPTAIENTEVKANAKGIFTLTGQFVGEMNVWNTLPAGVYVVNGAKRVK